MEKTFNILEELVMELNEASTEELENVSPNWCG